MRRILAAALVAAPLAATARNLPAGTLEVSGASELNLSSTEIEIEGAPDTDVDGWEARVSALYYVVPNFGIGVAVQHESTETSAGTLSTDQSTTLIGPQLGANLSLSDQVSLKGFGGVFYATTSVDDVDLDGFGWALGGGVSFFLHRYVSLDATLSYQQATVEDDFDNEADLSGFNLGAGLTIYFGGR